MSIDLVTAIVPLREPGHGKSRLAADLDAEQRAVLAESMLATVVHALRSAEVQPIVIAAGGQRAAAAAAALGIRAVLDTAAVTTLDGAVAAVAGTLEVRDLLVVAADLPGVSAADIEAIVASRAAVVIAPTRDGGTAALLRRPHDVIATAYGPGSARRHHESALAVGASVATIHRPGLALDVDTWDDLMDARARGDRV